MRKTKDVQVNQKITVNIEELQGMLSVGRNTASKIGEDANAVVRIGRRKLYNVEKIKKFIDDSENDDERSEQDEAGTNEQVWHRTWTIQ